MKLDNKAVGLVGLRSVMLGAMLMVLSCGGGGGGGGGGGTNPPAPVSGQALLGPLSGAAVTVYAADNRSTAVYTTTATSSSDISTAGAFTIPADLLANGTLYLISVSGGEDIDADDDGTPEVPTPNLGTIRLLATGADLKQGAFKINILTELACHQTAYDAFTGASAQTVSASLDRVARLLLSQSLDGDGDVDAADLMQWNPANATHRSALRQGWDTLAPYIASVRDGGGHAALTGILLSGITDSLISPGENEARRVALSTDGSTALVADWAEGLRFLDVTDPFDASYVNTVDTAGLAHAVAVSGDYAYVADGTNGLRVVNISTQTQEATGAAIAGIAQGVAVDEAGNYAYVAYDITTPGVDCALQVVDITDPTTVVPGASASVEGSCYDVAVDGGYAFIASGSLGLIVVDISDPGIPNQVSVPILPWPVTGTARGVALSTDGNYALVADDTQGLRVIDVTVPTAPVLTATLALPGTAMDVAVSGNRAYVAGDYQGLHFIDITDLSNPQWLGTVDTPDLAWGVTVTGSRAFVADFRGGLQVIDVTDAATAADDIAVGSVLLPAYAYSVAVSGNFAYAGDNASVLQVVDVSDPTAPVIVGEESTPGRGYGVVVSGGLAYVADHLAGLRVVDVLDPENPFIIGTDIDLPAAEPPFSLAVYGDNHAYMAQGIEGLRVVDVSVPSGLTHDVTLSDGSSYTYDVKVAGTNLYVAMGRQGMKVFSLANPAAPVLVGGPSEPVPGTWPVDSFAAHGIAVDGVYAYQANYYGGVQIYDISDPTDPDPAGAAATSGNSERIAVSGTYAYLADTLGGVQVIDVSDPDAPVVVCFINTPGQALDVAVAGGYLYVADREAGIRIYRAIP